MNHGNRTALSPPLLSVVLVLFVLSGCSTVTRKMQPDPASFTIEESMITPFKTTSTVSLINGQGSSEVVPLGKRANLQWVSDYQEWTDVAISHVSQLVQDAGGSVAVGGSKSLSLSVTEADLKYGSVMTNCGATLSLETGSGYTQSYSARNVATAGLVYLPKVACNGAVPRAVIQMLMILS